MTAGSAVDDIPPADTLTRNAKFADSYCERWAPRGWIIGRLSIRLLSIWISIRRNWCLPSGVANAAVNVKSASPTLTDRCCENASAPIDELPANCLLEKFRCRSEHRDIEPLLVSALRLRRTAMQSVLEIGEWKTGIFPQRMYFIFNYFNSTRKILNRMTEEFALATNFFAIYRLARMVLLHSLETCVLNWEKMCA